MKNKIIMDSSGDIHEFEGVDFTCVPLKILTDEREFVDEKNADIEQMVQFLKEYKGRATTACPGVGEYLEAYGDADNVYVITITGTLSGSHNAATIAARTYQEDNPGRKVYVFDSLSTGPEMVLMAEKIRELIEQELPFEDIVEKVEEYHKNTRLLFCLESLHNLVNNGRISATAAMIAGMLGIRMVGRASEEGTLQPLAKVKGAKKVIPELMNNMINMGYNGGKVGISHCENEEGAQKLSQAIIDKFPDAKVSIRKTGALCSFYAERAGMLVGFETEN